MPVSLGHSRNARLSGDGMVWLAFTGSPCRLPPNRMLPDVGRQLEESYEAACGQWMSLGRRFSRERRGWLADMPTAAVDICDFGLMLAWSGLVSRLARQEREVLVVCDDPWMFRHLETLPGVTAHGGVALWRRRLRLRLRGYASRLKVSLRVALAALLYRPQRRRHEINPGAPAVAAYGHPSSRGDGYDAYFGDLILRNPQILRILHTDLIGDRIRTLTAERHSASFHAWGNPLFALTLPFVRWRPLLGEGDEPYAWLIRRAAETENGGGALAMTRWQNHCHGNWLRSVRPRCVVWPWENHPWERDFVRRCGDLGVETRGYQHTVVGRHRLNFSPKTNFDGERSLPDRIICNGPAYLEQLIQFGLDPARLIIGGAFRFPAVGHDHYDPEGPVYVALSHITGIASQMLAAIKSLPANCANFVVKSHPMYPVNFDESENISRTQATIPEFRGMRAVLYSNGSTGLEGAMVGVPTWRFLPADRFVPDILPNNVRLPSITRSDIEAILDPRPEFTPVDWNQVMAPVDMAVWARELGLPAVRQDVRGPVHPDGSGGVP